MSALSVFIIFFLCLIIAIPISIGLGIVSVLPGIFDSSFTASGQFVIRSMLGGIDSFPLLAVPMFVLSGMVMAKGGISKKIFDVFVYFIGKFTAGMPCAVIVTCLFYGAISGSAPATVAAVGSMTIPILIKLGYDKKFATAIVAVSGGLGVIIPPSIPFIMYGMASGQSVSDLFIAGILPGISIGLLLMVYAVFYCRKHGEDKEKIRKEVQALHDKGLLTVLKDSFFCAAQSGYYPRLYLYWCGFPYRSGGDFCFLFCIRKLICLQEYPYKRFMGSNDRGNPYLRAYLIYTCSIRRIFKSPDSDAGSSDSQRVDSRNIPQ